MSVKEELALKYGTPQKLDYSSTDSYKSSMDTAVKAAVGASPYREKYKQFDKLYSTLNSDLKKFLTAAETDVNGSNGFNAAEYFEERQKQADALKQRAETLALYLEDNADIFNMQSYDSAWQNLTSFDESVNNALSLYQPSLDAQAQAKYAAEGLKNYEEEKVIALAEGSKFNKKPPKLNKWHFKCPALYENNSLSINHDESG